MATTAGAAGTTLRGPRVERQDDALTPEALAFLADEFVGFLTLPAYDKLDRDH